MLHSIVGDTSVVKVETDLFKGQVFWVIQGDSLQNKGELEVLIKRFGGKQSQSAHMEKTIVVAGENGRVLVVTLFELLWTGQLVFLCFIHNDRSADTN